MLSVHEEKYRLIWVVHDHPSLVFATQSVQALLLVVSVMKFKLGLSGSKEVFFFVKARRVEAHIGGTHGVPITDLNRPKGYIVSPLPSGEQQTDDLLDIVARPKDEVHLLCAAYHIL